MVKMEKTLLKTKTWHLTNGRVEKFHELAICKKDLFNGALKEAFSPKWPEMSYFKSKTASRRSVQHRLRDGE